MSDFLTDEEQAERLKKWWDANGVSLIVTLVLAVGAVIGWRYYQSWSEGRGEEASDAFLGYLEARAAGEPVADLLGTIDEEYDGTAYQVFALLYRASDEANEEEFEEALAHLEAAIDAADLPVLADLARLNAARVLYQLDRLDDCLAMLARIRSSGFEVAAAELSGDVLVAKGDPAGARDAYRAGIEAATEGGRVAPGLGILELKLASVPVEEGAEPDQEGSS
ncbi:MAG: tetratricopeptide repeat protein [Gammaproteobacteria bacterium]|nr:tetratricopeptide repeat protein [Gammaproteobacteria bacterium]